MKFLFSFLLCLVVSATVIGCKTDTKEEKEVTQTTKVKKEKKVLSEEEKVQMASVTARMMATPEIKTMTRYFVAADLGQYFMNEKGPFTVLSPTNEALKELPKEKITYLSNPKNKEELNTLLKGHVVEGNIDSKMMVQQIRDNGGSLKLSTLAGTTLTASMSGTNIMITDEMGNKATIVLSDINASNGVIHAMDKVLNLEKN